MAAMFRDIVVVRRRRAHAIHAACHMLTMKKRVFYACVSVPIVMVLCLRPFAISFDSFEKRGTRGYLQ